MNIRKQHIGTTDYYQKGLNPQLLLLSGMHGDEHEVSDCVLSYIQQDNKLPDLLFIPSVSPSGASQRTRLNIYGHDINRSFFDPPPDEEVRSCLHILSQHLFQLSLDFHEDPEKTNEFYMYDTGILTVEQRKRYRQCIEDAGLKLYNGVDDSGDKTLGFQIHDGYISTPIKPSPKDTGFSSGYFIRHHVSKLHFTLETPGKLEVPKKSMLVAALFNFFLPFIS